MAISLPKITTADELEAMPDDGFRYDLIRGELIRMSPAGRAHGRLAARLGHYLYVHVIERGLGEVYGAETGFVVAQHPDVVLGPDVSYVRHDRLAGQDEERYLRLAPDLAAEVVSPNDRMRDVQAKVDEYLKAGTKLVWVFHPRRRTVTVYRGGGTVQVLTERDELTGADVLPEFRIAVAELFQASQPTA